MTVSELGKVLAGLPLEDQEMVVVCDNRLIDGVERLTQPIVWGTNPVDVIHLSNDLIDVVGARVFNPEALVKPGG